MPPPVTARAQAAYRRPRILAPTQQDQSRYQSQHDPTRFVYPIVVEGELEKEANAEYQGQDADAGQPVPSQPPLPIPARRLIFGRMRGLPAYSKVWRRRHAMGRECSAIHAIWGFRPTWGSPGDAAAGAASGPGAGSTSSKAWTRRDSPTTSDCRSRTAARRASGSESSTAPVPTRAWAVPQNWQKLTPEGISSPQLEQFTKR